MLAIKLRSCFDSTEILRGVCKCKQTDTTKRKSNLLSCEGAKTVLMIIKKNSTYEIRSEKGKLLGRYLTEAAAKRRLQQIEYFKKKK